MIEAENIDPRGLVQHNISLQDKNTLAIDARAALYVAVGSVEELQQALAWWKAYSSEQGLPSDILVLGGGSNIVLAQDFCGLVLHIKLLGRDVVAEDNHHIWLQLGAGENWHDCVCHCMQFHYWGLENLALIPGTVGAAPIQNIGAYGVEISERLEELRAVEISSGLEVTFTNEHCGFNYRDSVFKGRLKDRYIITSVTLKLLKHPQPNCDYPALKHELQRQQGDSLTIAGPEQVFAAVCAVRQSKLPDPAQIPNAGSFFKNPIVSADQFATLQQSFPDIVGYQQPASGQVKLAAGWLVEACGWKGRSLGSVAVHKHQALVLTNPGRGQGGDVLALASQIQQQVSDKFAVDLEIEPRVY